MSPAFSISPSYICVLYALCVNECCWSVAMYVGRDFFSFFRNQSKNQKWRHKHNINLGEMKLAKNIWLSLFPIQLKLLLTGLLHLTMGGGIPSARHSNRTWLPSRASMGWSTCPRPPGSTASIEGGTRTVNLWVIEIGLPPHSTSQV